MLRRRSSDWIAILSAASALTCGGVDNSNLDSSRGSPADAADAGAEDTNPPIGPSHPSRDGSTSSRNPDDAGAETAPGMDASSDALSSDAALATDAPNHPATPGAGECDARVAWYADDDADGHGDPGTVWVACQKPLRGNWVTVADDCDDGDARVHPGQTEFFGTPYFAAGDVESYDFDCSGMEEPDALQQPASSDCGLLSLALCGGSGYAPTGRMGVGIHGFCGSKIVGTCRAALGILVCETIFEPTTEPFRCR